VPHWYFSIWITPLWTTTAGKMPHEFYHPLKTWYPTYISPFYCWNLRYASADDWRALRRLDTFNFLFHNTVLEPPTAPVPPSTIAPPHKVSELRVLDRLDTEYVIPTNGPIQRVMKRFDIYNFFKVDLTSKFLESPRPPSEIIIPSRKRKISDLDEIEY
jgi:hypothetical protein